MRRSSSRTAAALRPPAGEQRLHPGREEAVERRSDEIRHQRKGIKERERGDQSEYQPQQRSEPGKPPG